MAWAKDCFPGEREHLLPIIPQSIQVGHHAASQRTRENRVAHDRNSLGEALDKISDPTRRMPTGEAGFYLETAYLKYPPWAEGMRSFKRFPLADPGLCSGLLKKPVQIENMVHVNVRDENLRDPQALRGGKIQHGLAIGAGVKEGGFFA